MIQTYSDLAKMALKVLIPLATTYEYEAAFSILIHIKSKYRNRLDATHDMRVVLSKTQPKIDILIVKEEASAPTSLNFVIYFCIFVFF